MRVSLDKQPDAAPAGDATEPYDTDALRLLRRYHARRVLRALCLVELLAVAVWAAYSLSMEAYFERGSTNWQRIDDETGPGFVVILVALAVTWAATLAVGRFGHAGRIVRQLVPLTGHRRMPAIQPPGSAPAFQARLRRQGMVRSGAVVMLLLFGLLTVMSASSVWPAWRANHGHGDRVVTVTASTGITSETGGGDTTWFLSTPDGTAVAESGRPRPGERWAVTRDLFGNLNAYEVGGHDYLVVGAVFLLSALAVLAALIWQGAAVGTELRLRREEGDGPLSTDVRALAAGARPDLRLDGEKVARLGLPAAAGRHPRRTVLRRRLTGVGLPTALAVVLAVLLVQQQLDLLGAPPDRRETALPYVRAAGWDPATRISYVDVDTVTDRFREWAGRDGVGGVRRFELDRSEELPDGLAPSADLVVAALGPVPAATVTAGWGAYQDELEDVFPVDPVAGLPPGWTARYVQTGDRTSLGGPTGEVRAFRAVGGVAVQIVMSDSVFTDGKSARAPRAQVVGWVASLAAALDAAGLRRLELDTSRPGGA
ncbi:hypothetical protein [Jatrophihabitans fulvus]